MIKEQTRTNITFLGVPYTYVQNMGSDNIMTTMREDNMIDGPAALQPGGLLGVTNTTTLAPLALSQTLQTSRNGLLSKLMSLQKTVPSLWLMTGCFECWASISAPRVARLTEKIS